MDKLVLPNVHTNTFQPARESTKHSLLFKHKDSHRRSSKQMSSRTMTPSEQNDVDTQVENEKLLVKVFNSDKTYEMLNEFILNENRTMEDTQFLNKTKYANPESHAEYYKKFKNFTNIKRKGLVQIKTPSFEYIKACNNLMLVPNPLGLISKSGAENQVKLKNQKVGDKYLKALSEGIKLSDHVNELILSSNRLTFNGVSPLITSIQNNPKLSKKLRVLDLSYNKIGGEGVKKIISYILDENCELRDLNIEGNSIGDEMIIKLSDSITKNLGDKLVYLNLGKNQITDDAATSLANLISNCQNLQVMILCWNHLKNQGASLIINKLRKHNEMKIFDLSWNSIGNNLNQEATVEELQKSAPKLNRTFYNHEMNEFRRTMNIAFKKYANQGAANQANPKDAKNAKGKDNPIPKETMRSSIIQIQPKPVSAFAKELGDYFKEPSIELVHLDISHNNLSTEDCSHLALCVKSNHTILGLHVDGNEMTIDSLGFLHPLKETKEEDYFAKSQIYYGMTSTQPTLSNFSSSQTSKVRKIRAKNNCWICEGWKEVDIKYSPSQEICLNPLSHSVKLHLSSDDYKAFDTLQSGNSYFNKRMCPPGEINYFFSVDKNIMTDYGNKVINLKEPIQYEFDDEYNKEFNNLQLMNAYKRTETVQDTVSEANIEPTFNHTVTSELGMRETTVVNCNVFEVSTVGCFNVEINRLVLDEYNRSTLKYCVPRPERSFNRFVKPRTPWTYPVSIWAAFDYKYEGDTEEYLDEVYNNDFTRSFKEKEDLRPILRGHYRKILDCYRNLSSAGGSSIWQIQPTILKDFFMSCPGLLDATYALNDIIVKERGVKAPDKLDKTINKLKTVPDNIVRHQFLSLLVQVAADKYVRTKTYGLVEAVVYSMETHFAPAMGSYDVNSWRKERYYNEEVDNFYKAHMPIFDAVYKSWMNKEPGKREVWMTLEAFTDLSLRIVNMESFPVRELPLLFNLSIKLQVDEILSERHYRMQFYEFLEGLARVVDKEKSSEPLINKLEKVLPEIIKLITNQDFKLVREKFPLPTKDPSSGLYNIDYTNPFYQGLDFRAGRTVNMSSSRRSII